MTNVCDLNRLLYILTIKRPRENLTGFHLGLSPYNVTYTEVEFLRHVGHKLAHRNESSNVASIV